MRIKVNFKSKPVYHYSLFMFPGGEIVSCEYGDKMLSSHAKMTVHYRLLQR